MAARGTTRFRTGVYRFFCHHVASAMLAVLCWLPAVAAASPTQPDRQFRDFIHDTWSLEAGLPQRSVTAIAQGPQGYLWVATQHALARFDGVRFQSYTTLEEPALPGNDISTLFQASDGSLWIGSYRGLTRFDGREFEAIAGPRTEDAGMMDVAVGTMTEDHRGRVVAGGADGLFRVEDGRLAPMDFPEPQAVGGLHAEGDVMWVGGVGRFWRYDDGEPVDEHVLPTHLETARVNGFRRHGGNLWVATSAGLFRHTESGLQAFGGPAANVPINAMLVDSSDTLWVGTDATLLRIREGRLAESIDDDHPAGHSQIRSMYEDHEGNLWLGSNVDGLARYWSGWVDRYSEAAGLTVPLVWSVADAGDGALWVGTSDGLFRLADDRYAEIVPGRELPHPHVYTLQPDGEGLWIGTRSGLMKLDTGTGELTRPEVLGTLDTGQINGIVPAGPHGRYFFATAEGLYLWDGENRPEKDPVLDSRFVRQVRLFDDGEIMVATDGGAYRGAPGRLAAMPAVPPRLEDAHFVTVDELASGHLVLSTLDSGLLFGHQDRFVALTTADGLPSNSSYFLVDDEHGYLWVAGFEGLYRVAIADLEAFAAGAGDAVEAEMLLSESGRHRGSQQGYCCNGAGHAKGLLRSDGLWLPTRDGVVRIRPDRIERNAVAPPVLIERYRIGDSWHEVDGGDIPTLPRGARDLAFEFTALSFRDPASVQFRYRLEGFENNWQTLGGDMPRMSSYTNLPPGDYRFEVTAANNAGTWAEHPAGLDFRVPPHFHETAWFRVLAIGLTLLLLVAGYRWRRHQWSAQQATLQRQVRERTEELRLANARLMDANRALRDLSTIDTLTGLRNRRYLYEKMAKEPQRLDRMRERVPEDDLVLGFALIDVDHFKQVNDDYGHHAGDRVLEQVGERLHAIARKGDHVVRWGGEEFLLVLHGLPRADSAAALERISRAVGASPYRIDSHHDLKVTCSIGYAELPPRATDPVDAIGWEAVVEMADHALYRVKRRGRDGWALIRPAGHLDANAFVRATREDLDAVLDRGQAEIIFSQTMRQDPTL